MVITFGEYFAYVFNRFIEGFHRLIVAMIPVFFIP
jgi:hypothetical protein